MFDIFITLPEVPMSGLRDKVVALGRSLFQDRVLHHIDDALHLKITGSKAMP